MLLFGFMLDLLLLSLILILSIGFFFSFSHSIGCIIFENKEMSEGFNWCTKKLWISLICEGTSERQRHIHEYRTICWGWMKHFTCICQTESVVYFLQKHFCLHNFFSSQFSSLAFFFISNFRLSFAMSSMHFIYTYHWVYNLFWSNFESFSFTYRIRSLII